MRLEASLCISVRFQVRNVNQLFSYHENTKFYVIFFAEEKITDLEIPNGLPLIFDVKSKCIKLLDDGTGRDPLETYNFGKAASYLFRPCEREDGSADEECDIRWMSESIYANSDNYDALYTAMPRPKQSEKDVEEIANFR